MIVAGIVVILCVAAGTTTFAEPAKHTNEPQSPASPTQAQVGAAFIFNFAKFAEWPRQSFAEQNSALTICFLGADDYRSAFHIISEGKTVNGHPVAVREVKSPAEMRDCHIIYVNSSSNTVIAGVIKSARQSGALAIGSSEDFLARGGTIRLLVENNKMRFDVNVGAAGRTKIHLSSKLLALARSVVDLPDPVAD